MSKNGWKSWNKPTDDQVRRLLRLVSEGYSVQEAARATSLPASVGARLVRENGGVRKIRRGE